METTVQVADLLSIIRENRDKHRTVFEAALQGYETAALETLHRHIRRLETGDLSQIKIVLPMPADHTSDYNRVIKMLEMTVESTYKLADYEFGQYVMDDWEWKRQFIDTSTTYAAAAVSQNYGG